MYLTTLLRQNLLCWCTKIVIQHNFATHEQLVQYKQPKSKFTSSLLSSLASKSPQWGSHKAKEGGTRDQDWTRGTT